MMVCSAVQGEGPGCVDNFRKMEKRVRSFVKATCGGKAYLKQLKKNIKAANIADLLPTLAVSDIVDPCNPDERLRAVDGMGQPSACPVYTLSAADSHPSGLYILRGALSREQQLHWATEALESYSTAEHTNLTNLNRLRAADGTDSGEAPSRSEPDESSGSSGRDIWRRAVEANDGLQSLMGLRWASLGYHYNWTERCYQPDLKSAFPPALSSLCQSLAAQVGWDAVRPEAAIVNYYPAGASMGGHLDDAEINMEQPIISLSIGRSAIFMIGGRSKDIPPVAIVVRSGDVVVMSGESRYCYHGVPHVLSADEEKILFPDVTDEFSSVDISRGSDGSSGEGSDDASLAAVKYFLTIGRININVRQVVHTDGVWVNKCGSGAMKY